jgi:hypothetical protein
MRGWRHSMATWLAIEVEASNQPAAQASRPRPADERGSQPARPAEASRRAVVPLSDMGGRHAGRTPRTRPAPGAGESAGAGGAVYQQCGWH